MDKEVKQEELENYDPFGDIDLSAFEVPEASVNFTPEGEEDEEEIINKPVANLEDTEEDEEDNGDGASSQDTKKSSPFTPFAKLLVEEAATPNLNLEEFDGTPQGLVKAIQDEINYGVNAYKEQLNPRVKWLQDNIDEGVAFEDLLTIDKQRMTLSSIDDTTLESDENLQKQIVKEYLKETTRFNDTLIEKQLERLLTTGELKDEALTSFNELKTINAQKEQLAIQQAQQQRAAAEEANKKALEDFKSSLDKVDEIVPGIKLNKNVREQIFKTLTTPVAIDPMTKQPVNAIAQDRAKNPVEFERNLAYVWLVTKGFKDFSALGASGKKSAIKEFEEALNNQGFHSSKQNIQDSDSIKELKESMKFFMQK